MNKKLIAFVSFALCTACPLALADDMFVDIGYSPKNGSTLESIGLGAYVLKTEGTGFFLNGTLAVNPDNYIDSGMYGTAVDYAKAPYTINLGATFPIIPSGRDIPIYKSIHSYIGLGYGRLEGRVADRWGYWYKDPSRDENGLNITGGFILGFNGWGINLGANSYTKTIYLGIGLMAAPK